MSKTSRRTFLKGVGALLATSIVASEHTQQNQVLKLIHITDSHMDLSDQQSIDALELMVSFINKHYKDVDCVLFGGDNFNNNVSGNKDALKFKEIIDKLHPKTLIVRGNKESSPKPQGDGINLNDFKKILLDDSTLQISTKDWLYETKGYAILGLDSCIDNANNGIYTKETINFAKSVLDKNKPTIMLNHHPYINYWGGTKKEDLHKYILNNTKEVQQTLFGYKNLILTLSGHKHIDSVKEISGTKVIATRGFIRPLDLDMYPMRYIEINGYNVEEKLIYTS